MSAFESRRNISKVYGSGDAGVAGIAQIYALNKGAISANKQLADAMYTMQGDDFSQDSHAHQMAQGTYDGLVQSLSSTELFSQPMFKSDVNQRLGTRAAAITMMAMSDPQGWLNSMATVNTDTKDGTVHIADPRAPGMAYADASQFTLQGFDAAASDQWAAVSAAVNAMATVTSTFEQLFFRQIIVPAGSGGYDVSMAIPHVQSVSIRGNASGTPYSINRIPLVKALRDSSILRNLDTTVFPVATDGTTPAKLVPVAEWPNRSETQGGHTFNTRPILFGTEVDLLGVSTHPGVVPVGGYDETDQIEPTVNCGKVCMQVSMTDGGAPATTIVAKFEYDISKQVGAFLQKAAAGSDRAYITNAPFRVVLTEKTEFVAVSGGTAAEFRELVNAGIGQAADARFKMVIRVRLAAASNTEFSNTRIDNTETAVEALYGTGNAAKIFTAPHAATPTAKGYFPLARRTSSNFRTQGKILDGSVINNFRFPVMLSAPFIFQHPHAGQPSISVDHLAAAQRALVNNNAHLALLAARSTIQAEDGLANATPALSKDLVVPTYRYRELDVAANVLTMNSKDGLANMRAVLQQALIHEFNQGILDSNVLCAAEFLYGNADVLEPIVVTDPKIYGYLMEAGDPRFMGNNREFSLSMTQNDDFAGKIFMSVRRKTADATPSPVDFGMFLNTPTLIHTIDVWRNNRTNKETHSVACNAHYVTCPFLIEIDVVGLEDYYFQEAV